MLFFIKYIFAPIAMGAVLALSSPVTDVVAATVSERAVILPASPEDLRRQEAVFAFLHDYFSALAEGQVEKLSLYHPTLTPEQLAILRSYFATTIRDLHISLQHVRVHVVANTAVVDFDRTDTFVDRLTGRPIEKSISLSTTLVHNPTGWSLAGTDQIAFALI